MENYISRFARRTFRSLCDTVKTIAARTCTENVCGWQTWKGDRVGALAETEVLNTGAMFIENAKNLISVSSLTTVNP